MILLCTDPGGPYRDLAEEFAAEYATEVISTVAEVGRGPVLYVTDPTTVGEDVVLSLQQRLLEQGPETGAFGIITGHTPSAARTLYDRGRASRADDTGTRDSHAVLLREETKDWFSYDDETTVLTGDDVTVEALSSSLSELQSVSMLVHGRSIHFFLSDGFLCGFPNAQSHSFDGPQPYCVTDNGELDCPLDGDLLHADEVDIPHLFVDSCASMLPENDFEGLPVHVGMGLLDGAESVLGVYRQIDSIPQLSVLHYCLLRAGYTAAERCYLLNRAAHAYNTAAFPYAPFGHPESAITSTADQSVEVESIDDTTVTLRNVDAHVVDVRLDLPVTSDELYVRNRTDELANAPLYAVAFQQEGAVRLLVYTWGRFELDELVLEVDDEPLCASDRDIVVDSLANAERLRPLKYLDSKAKGQLKSVRNRFEGIGDDLHEQRYNVNVYRQVEDQMEKLTEALERIENRVASTLTNRYSTFLSDDYRDDFRKTMTATVDRTCSNCDRHMFEKRMENPSGETRRLRGICPLCGVVYDVPDTERPPSWPHIEGEFVPVLDDSITFDISFENPLDRAVRATYLPWLGIDHDEFRGREVFTPDSVTTQLEPGERHSVTFELDASDLDGNEYWVCGYVIGNLNVYQGLRKMVVGTEYGHLREDLRRSST